MRISLSGLAALLVCLHAQPKRPQTPQAPFPYDSQEVRVRSQAPGVTLACTLTIPPGEGPHPAMVLLTGSGPQDRDETVFGHKAFLVMADYLARHGVGALRCDDRGTGKSTGRFLGATTADFSLDAEGAFHYLLNRPEFKRVGIAGHSEGAVIAPMVAARRAAVAFVIMLAGVGVRGDRAGYAQAADIKRAKGVPEEAIERNRRMQQALIALARTGATESEMRRQARERFATVPDSERIILLLQDPWHRWFIDYDPSPMLEKVKCPVLVLNGDLDLQVVADVNVPAIESALRKGGNPHVMVRRFPGLNHLFQPAITGLPDEYPQIEETIAPAVLETITKWLDETLR